MVTAPLKSKITRLPPFARRFLFTFAGVAGVFAVLSSERFVDFAFGFGDYPDSFYAPRDFPLEQDRIIALSEWGETPLPAHIKQSSGLDITNGYFAIATDKASVHWGQQGTNASAPLAPLAERTLLRRPLALRQGYLEALALGPTPQTVFAMGGSNQLHQITVTQSGLKTESVTTLQIPSSEGQAPEVVGLAYNKASDSLFVGYSRFDDSGVGVSEFSLSGEFIRALELTAPNMSQTETKERLANANVSGLTFVDQTLVILSDRHSSLIWANPTTGEIERVWGIDGLRDLSAISYDNGALYLMQDHEYYQETPPLRVLPLEQPAANS